jgi:hypothetical protein
MRRNVAVVAALLLAPTVTACERPQAFSGAELYAAHCASCHGRYGEGDGPATADLTHALVDLRYLAARSGGEFPRERVRAVVDGREVVSAHGDRLMPVWGDAFVALDDAPGDARARATARLDALVDYLAGIQQAR